VNTAPEQVTLDARVVDSEVSQVECDQAGPSTKPDRLGRLGVVGLPLPVPFLQRNGQTEELTPGHRREPAEDGEHSTVAPTGHPKADTPVDGALEGRVSAARSAESKAPSCLVEVEFESLASFVESVSKTT
jgi:hypothetical protein